MKDLTIFDIHLGSDKISRGLEQRLAGLGFKRDDFVGGTTGVVHPCHYSTRPTSREMLDQSWKAVINTLSAVSGDKFYGYAEAEVTPNKYRALLSWKPFDASVVFPFGRLEHQECPLGQYKDFDIHITADLSLLDPDLKRLLEEEISFYYVDIRKPKGNVVRIYTFQPLGVKETPNLYSVLLAYFKRAGGLEGKIKLEATYAFARFPQTAPVPPVITKAPQKMMAYGGQRNREVS